jgi:probable rRNA maturation factor
MEIDVLIESRKWSGLHLERLAGDAVLAALDDLGLEPEQFAVSILACDDARIAGLNADFRGKPVPTNVLSWPSEERAAAVRGRCRICRPRIPSARRWSLAISRWPMRPVRGRPPRRHNPLADHVTHLLVHGLLHLLGFDHETEADAELNGRS